MLHSYVQGWWRHDDGTLSHAGGWAQSIAGLASSPHEHDALLIMAIENSATSHFCK